MRSKGGYWKGSVLGSEKGVFTASFADGAGAAAAVAFAAAGVAAALPLADAHAAQRARASEQAARRRDGFIEAPGESRATQCRACRANSSAMRAHHPQDGGCRAARVPATVVSGGEADVERGGCRAGAAGGVRARRGTGLVRARSPLRP